MCCCLAAKKRFVACVERENDLYGLWSIGFIVFFGGGFFIVCINQWFEKSMNFFWMSLFDVYVCVCWRRPIWCVWPHIELLYFLPAISINIRDMRYWYVIFFFRFWAALSSLTQKKKKLQQQEKKNVRLSREKYVKTFPCGSDLIQDRTGIVQTGLEEKDFTLFRVVRIQFGTNERQIESAERQYAPLHSHIKRTRTGSKETRSTKRSWEDSYSTYINEKTIRG